MDLLLKILLIYLALVSLILLRSYSYRAEFRIRDLIRKRKERYWDTVFTKMINDGDHSLNKEEVSRTFGSMNMKVFFSRMEKHGITDVISQNTEDLVRVWKKYIREKDMNTLAYCLSRSGNDVISGSEELGKLLSGFLNRVHSHNARKNILAALFRTGHAEHAVNGLLFQSRRESFFSSRIIENILLGYRGDLDELGDLLNTYFQELDNAAQIAVADYMNRKDMKHCDQLFMELMKNRENDSRYLDVKCALIRNSGILSSEEGICILKDILSGYMDDPELWPLSAVAAKRLGNIAEKGSVSLPEITDALSKSINSRKWYVRLNSARSLARIGVSDETVMRINGSEDRYAIEILDYSLYDESLKEAVGK